MLPEANILAEYRKLCPDYIPRENHVNDECYNKFRCAFKRGWDIGYFDRWKDRKKEEFKKGYSPTSEIEKEKPPLGLRPKKNVISLRIQEITEAINNFNAEGKQIPSEWVDELRELTKMVGIFDPGPYIIYYNPGSTMFEGNPLENQELAKIILNGLLENKHIITNSGFRIAQKINGEYKEIFPTKENP